MRNHIAKGTMNLGTLCQRWKQSQNKSIARRDDGHREIQTLKTKTRKYCSLVTLTCKYFLPKINHIPIIFFFVYHIV